MTLLDFLALTLAASAVVDVWFNGSILAGPLAYCQARADDTEAADYEAEAESDSAADAGGGVRLADLVIPTWLCKLLSCAFCLSHHTPWLLAALFYVPGLFLEPPWSLILKVPLYSLAATRLGNILNAAAPASTQYDRYKEL